MADGFVGVTVEGLLAGAATPQCSASLLPLISAMAKGPLRIRPLVLPGPAATRSPLCQHKHSTQTQRPLSRPSLSTAGWQLAHCAVPPGAPALHGFSCTGNGLQEPLPHGEASEGIGG